MSARREVPLRIEDRLIVALDVPSVDEARMLIRQLDGFVSFFKIGLWLQFAAGFDSLIDELTSRGKKIFLDAKMFDIGETVRQGVARAAERGISFLTVHGDGEIMQAAVEGRGNSPLKILAITVLTSVDGDGLRDLGYLCSVGELIRLRVLRSIACGCDGIIAAPHDNPNEIRRLAGAESLLIATPGVRLAGTSAATALESVIFAGTSADVRDVVISGRDVVRDGRHLLVPDVPGALTAAIQAVLS